MQRLRDTKYEINLAALIRERPRTALGWYAPGELLTRFVKTHKLLALCIPKPNDTDNL